MAADLALPALQAAHIAGANWGCSPAVAHNPCWGQLADKLVAVDTVVADIAVDSPVEAAWIDKAGPADMRAALHSRD